MNISEYAGFPLRMFLNTLVKHVTTSIVQMQALLDYILIWERGVSFCINLFTKFKPHVKRFVEFLS